MDIELVLQFLCFFFFQAEDGIRDLTVTGVQTCALPILSEERKREPLQIFYVAGIWDEQLQQKRHDSEHDNVQPNRSGKQQLGSSAHCAEDRKSTRLNSSHSQISYAVFCLKKKIAPTRSVIVDAPSKLSSMPLNTG